MEMRLAYAIVFVSDMARSVAFYRDVLGLPLRFETPEWTEFSTDGATLALHASHASKGSEGAGDDHLPGSCRPGLNVPSLDAFHARLVDHKVRCVQPPKETFGVRIAQYLDPDGLVISVGEMRQ
jgi:lactoylglutathione lyase